MKKDKTKKYINDFFDKIESLSKKSAEAFRKEDIHRFRVEIKKIRAFLRLINVELGKPSVLKVPKSIKKFYKRSGDIRNMQNHLAWVNQFFRGKSRPSGYLSLLRNLLKTYKLEMHDALPPSSRFEYERERIVNKLPDKFSTKSIKEFINQKKSTIKQIISEEKTDDKLHSLRKALKDIQYNTKFIKPHMAEAEVFINDMDNLVDTLGDHQDYFIHLYYLRSSAVEN